MNETGAEYVEVFMEGGTVSFDVDSPHYAEKADWFSKGEWEIVTDPRTAMRVLKVQRLEKDLNITINRPTIIGAEDLPPEDKEKAEEFLNTEITVGVIHRPTGDWTARETRRKHSRAFAEACVRNIVNKGLDIATMTSTEEIDRMVKERESEFSVIEIDWANKSMNITKLEEK